MTLFTFHGNPNGQLAGALGDIGYDVDSVNDQGIKNRFECMGGTVWEPYNLSGQQSGAWGGLVSGTVTQPGSRWITITKLDLYDAKAAAYVDAADSVQLGTGQSSRSAQVIADVTAEIRRKVARCNVLDSDATKIPGGLKNAALDIIIARLKVSLEQELSADEKESLKARERELNRIADGKDLVDPPDNPVAANMSQTDVGVQQATTPVRAATRDKMGGLI